MKHQLAIFDFDGTLADTLPWVRSVMNETARKFRFREVTDEEMEMLRGRPNREIVRYMRVPDAPAFADGVYDGLRTTVGTDAEIDRLLDVLRGLV